MTTIETTTTTTLKKNGTTKPTSGPENKAIASSVTQLLPISTIKPSPMNPRKHFDAGAIAELAASIKRDGLSVPLRVRPKNGGYEIVFGERRWHALQKIGEEVARCEVVELTDDEALDQMLIEFLHRVDLEPMEEAEAFGVIRARGVDISTLCFLVSKPEAYVYKRLRLLTLCAKARKALTDGTLTLGAALQLTRLEDHGTQEKILPRLLGDDAVGKSPASAAEARDEVLQQMRVLARAPWKRDDEQLVAAAGSCTKCPKRSAAQAALFDEAVSGDDKCTDAKCWDSKLKAHGKSVLAQAKAKGLPIIDNLPKGTWEYSGDQLSYQAPYVDLTKSTMIGQQHKTWKEVLKDSNVKIMTAVDENGGAHELADKKAAEAFAKKLTPTKRKTASSSSSGASGRSSSSASTADHSNDDALLDAVDAAHVVAVVAKAEKASASVIMRMAIDDLLSAGVGNIDRVISRRCWKASGNAAKTLRAAAEKMQLEQLQGLFAEILVSEDLDHCDEALKIDVKAIEKKVAADFKAAEDAKNKSAAATKASPATSAKPTTKKKAAKKGGKR